MFRFKPLALLSMLLAFLPACSHHTPPAATTAQFPFQDPALTMKDRAADLVARMTLDEKIGQMQMDAPAIERLGVAPYHWWNEGLHGVARNGAATVFPQAIGMAAAWNPGLHHEMAQVIAVEARAKHQEALRQGRHGINTGLDLWSPNINIFRDPRWGRGQETYGEDPYLTSRLAVAYVTGIQGDDPVYFQAIATPKHFAVHSGPELERHRIDNQVSNRDLYGTYLPAFEAAVREGKAYSIMGAYNRLDGVPCCCNPLLLTTLLRDKWGFQGYVVSDVGAIGDIYLNHQFVGTAEEATALAVKAGCDLDGGSEYGSLQAAVQLGLIKPAEIDTAVTRLMLARLRLGEFDVPPKCPYANTPYDANDSPAHDQLAREVARQSMVLLKNQNHLLPLSKSLRTIAVIGPTADSVPVLLGNYNGTPSHPVTILQGIRNALPPTAQVIYEPGSPLVGEVLPLEELVPAGCLFTSDSLQHPGLRADYYKEGALAGRPSRTRVDATVDFDWTLQSPRNPIPGSENFSVVWKGYLVPPSTGDYQLGVEGAGAFRIYLDDRRILDDWTLGPRRTMGAQVHLKAKQAYAIRIEYYHAKDDPAIQLRWTRPESEPYYAAAVRAAEKSDAVVMVLGLTAALEREQDTAGFVGYYGGDRQSLDLPPVQEALLEAVAKTGKPVVLVLTSGSALSINWANEKIPAILQAWYPGEEGGSAVADVLFGDYNPGGKLPVTFYKSIDDLPAFEDYSMANRTYRFFKGQPLYPFGYGLSYTKFQYSDLQVAPGEPTTGADVSVKVTVKNVGERAGDEVVELYVARVPHLADDPLKSLEGFLRVPLKAGEEKTVQFTLTPYQLAEISKSGEHENSPGEIEISLPSNSGTLTKTITLTGGMAKPEYRFVGPRIIQPTP